MNVKWPIELYIYEDEAHDVPVEAWRLPDEKEPTVRYLCAELKCNDCKGYRDTELCNYRECAIDRTDRPACMAFVLAD
jgi:hypothetical protein